MIRYVLMMSQKSAVYLSGTIYNTAVFFGSIMSPTRTHGTDKIEVDPRGTPTARGRQCRMSKKDKRRVRRGSREQKHTEHTNRSA